MSPRSTVQQHAAEETAAPGLNRREALVLAGEAALATALIGCGSGPMEGACAGAGTGTPLPGAEQVAIGDAGFFPASTQLFVIARDEGGFMAMKNYCTHAGCSVRLTEQKTLICDCHGSEFGLDGTLMVGPALRPLDHVAMCRRSDGVLVANKNMVLPGLDVRVK